MAKTSLRSVALLLLGLPFLAFAGDVPAMANVDASKLVGKWYPVKAVNTNPDPVALHAYTAEAAADGTITMNFQIPKDGACDVKKLTGSTKSPGVFSSADGDATIMDTDYKTYLVAYISKGDLRLVTLYARDKQVSEKVEKKFNALVQKVGLKSAHPLEAKQEDICTSPPA